jgi:hypothetical protein
MKQFLLLSFSLILSFQTSLAQQDQQPVAKSGMGYFDTEIPRKADREFQFFGFFINQGVTSNFYPTSEFLRGQVVGRLFGRNTTTTSDSLTSAYIEQRFIPFFVYQPHLFNGKATLRASFEIDWTWGDAAYGSGGNLGGAISADQVNIQTQNIMVEYRPAKGWGVNMGLMRMFDTPHDTYRTYVDKMMNTGYRLGFFGTDAVGLIVRNDRDFSRYKAGYYKFYENDIFRDDDVNMYEFTTEHDLTPKWKIGGSVYYVRDRATGKGGVSILGQGLNSLLAEYNGVFKFNFGTNPYHADIAWLGTYFSRNADMMLDRWFLTGFAKYNVGDVRVQRNASDGFQSEVTVSGLAANLRTGFRYGQTTDDFIRADLTYTSGDDNGITDGVYNGVMTGNTWGSPGGIFISTGSYLMLPHTNVVNRFTPVVADISNMGYGLQAGVFTFSRGFIPHKFIGRIGTATAFSSSQPLGGSRYMGTEFNSALVYNLGPFMSLEGHAAYFRLGGFFDSNDARYGAPINGREAGRAS